MQQTAGVALFCTDTFAEAHAREIAEAAPGVEVIGLRDGEEIGADAIGRITMAFFSNDAWPQRAPSFFRVVLGARNLRWFHTMSAGVDSPVFAGFLIGCYVMKEAAEILKESGETSAAA